MRMVLRWSQSALFVRSLVVDTIRGLYVDLASIMSDVRADLDSP